MKLKKTKLVVKCPACNGKGYKVFNISPLPCEGVVEDVLPCAICESSGWLEVFEKIKEK